MDLRPVNRDARTFRLRDTERGTVGIRVTRNARFERIAGFAALRLGRSNIEASCAGRAGRWIAREVERSGGGGGTVEVAAAAASRPHPRSGN